jgi:hypothetical protein
MARILDPAPRGPVKAVRAYSAASLVTGVPAPAPDRAVLAQPADTRRKHTGLDGGEDLRGQAVEVDVRRVGAGGPVAV